MRYDPSKHHRRSIRLKGYDYTQAGAYFVTIVTQNRICLFGDIVEGEVRLSALGQIVAESWQWLAMRYEYVDLDECIIMPNHLHGIIVITDDGRGGSRTAPTIVYPNARCLMGGSRTAPTAGKRKPIGRLIGALKTVSTKAINEQRGTPGASVWQRNYYEHVIRNEDSLNRIREYIITNPLRWHLDRENIHATETDPSDTEWFR